MKIGEQSPHIIVFNGFGTPAGRQGTGRRRQGA
jgi:hypothetical protein